MDLDGHYLITKQAMEETRGKISFFPAATDLAAVNRDLEDLAGGHWLDFGQKHHFMCIKGDTQEKAYNDAMGWIKSHAQEAARLYIGGFGAGMTQGACYVDRAGPPFGRAADAGRVAGAVGSGPHKGQKTVPWEFPKRVLEYDTMVCSGARPLGTAAHAVEDSFAPKHVIRDGGKIMQILVYADQTEEDHHDEEDRKWEGHGGGFSAIGRAAVDAVKDLFAVVDAAVRSGQPALLHWQGFVDKWFQPAFKGKSTPLVNVVPPTAPVVRKPSQLTSVGPRHHTVKSGESLSIIAGGYYGDVLLWPVIYDANRQTVKNPNLIQPGWLLNIPESSTISDTDKPALRQRGLHWRSAG